MTLFSPSTQAKNINNDALERLLLSVTQAENVNNVLEMKKKLLTISRENEFHGHKQLFPT